MVLTQTDDMNAQNGAQPDCATMRNRSHHSQVGYVLAFSILVAALLGYWLSQSSHYPFYFLWDMDFLAAEDAINLQSQRYPVVLSHPCFGMYLCHAESQRLAHRLGVVSVLGMGDLESSLNPAACMAELVAYLRLHSPFLVLGIVLCLWIALVRMLRPGRLWSLLLLAVLGSLESLSYHACMIRTEQYSLLAWGGALILLMAAVRARRSSWQFAACFLAGILLGLAFLTKIQVFFYLIASVLLLLFAFTVIPNSFRRFVSETTRRQRRLVFALSLLCLVCFAVLLLLSLRTEIPNVLKTYARAGYGLQPVALLLMLAIVSLAGYQGFMAFSQRPSSGVCRLSALMTLLFAGFLASFLLHFLCYSNWHTSWHYMLFDAKIVFFRKYYYEVRGISHYFRILSSFVRYTPVVFGVHAFALLFLVAGRRLGYLTIRWRSLLLAGMLSALAIASVAMGTRFCLRDLLWVEVLLSMLSLGYLTCILQYAVRRRAVLVVLCVAAAVSLLAVNVAHSRHMLDRIDAAYNVYGWEKGRLFEPFSSYADHRRLMRERYPDDATRDIGFETAQRHREIRDTVDFVFKNQNLTLRNVGVVAANFPVWSADVSWRILEFPEAVRGGVVVDSGAAPLRRGPGLMRVDRASELLDKFSPHPIPGRLAVLPRQDLKIYLFTSGRDFNHLWKSAPAGDALRIQLIKRGAQRECLGQPVGKYTEIPVGELRDPYFFVIANG